MVPMFERANVSKILMPAIFLFGSVVMNVTAPGSPSALMMALSNQLGTNIFSGITGASLNGTQIFCQTMADSYMAWGCDAGALQKVVSIASMGLDTLPHCPTYIMMAAVIGVSTKEAYKDVCVTTVIFPIVLSTIAALLAMMGIIF